MKLISVGRALEWVLLANLGEGYKNHLISRSSAKKHCSDCKRKRTKHQEVVAVSFFSKAAQRKGCFWPLAQYNTPVHLVYLDL